jgi:hypothetical protein
MGWWGSIGAGALKARSNRTVVQFIVDAARVLASPTAESPQQTRTPD